MDSVPAGYGYAVLSGPTISERRPHRLRPKIHARPGGGHAPQSYVLVADAAAVPDAVPAAHANANAESNASERQVFSRALTRGWAALRLRVSAFISLRLCAFALNEAGGLVGFLIPNSEFRILRVYRKHAFLEVTAADLFALVDTGAAGSATRTAETSAGDHHTDCHREDDHKKQHEGEGKCFHESTYPTGATG